ncbi:MAG: hypothetical protein KF803_02555 [Cyclobacteriaceae bacterium]|nr:hypothetical protein [Cyclobacteriaceae bacterium]
MSFTSNLVFILFLLACNQISSRDQDKTELYEHWIHSYEEDDAANQLVTYRPASYEFPPARGRTGFEIKPDGILINYPIAPFDGNLRIIQSWKLENNRLIFIGKDEIIQYEIIQLSKEKLVLKTIK